LSKVLLVHSAQTFGEWYQAKLTKSKNNAVRNNLQAEKSSS